LHNPQWIITFLSMTTKATADRRIHMSVTLPQQILDQIDITAGEKGMNRSRLIEQILRRSLWRRKGKDQSGNTRNAGQ
jgi:metal-responsive CopG/Arc/MetJ family transcriptional regulator